MLDYCLLLWCSGGSLPAAQAPPASSTVFPQLFKSRTKLMCVKDKTGQGKGIICLLGKFLWNAMLLHGCWHPHKLYVSKKPGAFHLLSFIPFSSWFSFTQECQSTIQVPGCNQDSWLLVKTSPTSFPLPQFYLVLSMFLHLTIVVPITVFLDFSGSFPLILSFQSCFYKAKHPIFFS